jgi:nucleoside-diphosphate-sugar epimerase
VKGPARAGDVQCNYLNASRAKRELGWKVTTSFAQGVKATADYFRRK